MTIIHSVKQGTPSLTSPDVEPPLPGSLELEAIDLFDKTRADTPKSVKKDQTSSYERMVTRLKTLQQDTPPLASPETENPLSSSLRIKRLGIFYKTCVDTPKSVKKDQTPSYERSVAQLKILQQNETTPLMNHDIRGHILTFLQIIEIAALHQVCLEWRETTKKIATDFIHKYIKESSIPLPRAAPHFTIYNETIKTGYVFGGRRWEAEFGLPFENPEIPLSLFSALCSPSPINSEKLTCETHILIYLPEFYKGKPLTSKRLVDTLLSHHPENYPWKLTYKSQLFIQFCSEHRKEKNKGLPNHWVLAPPAQIVDSIYAIRHTWDDVIASSPERPMEEIQFVASAMFRDLLDSRPSFKGYNAIHLFKGKSIYPAWSTLPKRDVEDPKKRTSQKEFKVEISGIQRYFCCFK